jgi:hypothetical protein
MSFVLQQFIERRIAFATCIRIRGCRNSPVFECERPYIPRIRGYRSFTNHFDTNGPSIPTSKKPHPKHLRLGDTRTPYGSSVGTFQYSLNDEFAVVLRKRRVVHLARTRRLSSRMTQARQPRSTSLCRDERPFPSPRIILSGIAHLRRARQPKQPIMEALFTHLRFEVNRASVNSSTAGEQMPIVPVERAYLWIGGPGRLLSTLSKLACVEISQWRGFQ